MKPPSRSDSGAALRLIRVLCMNLIEHGDLPEEVREHLDAFWQYLNTVNEHSTKQDDDWVSWLVVSGILPSFQTTDDFVELEAQANLIALTERRRRRAQVA